MLLIGKEENGERRTASSFLVVLFDVEDYYERVLEINTLLRELE